VDQTEFDAERLRVLDAGRSQAHIAQKLTRELKQLDPFLEVVFVGDPRVPDWEMPPGMHRNRWHVRRTPPEALDTYWPIMGPDGEFMDLDHSLIDRMKAADLWRPGALQEMRDRQEKEARRREAERALSSEQRIDEGAAIYSAAKRMAGDGGLYKRRWGAGRAKAA
jgi:hypothetical protein